MEISISIENLRRIQEMPFVALRPITLLVGRNSAGKSTFLRSFPLLRQSIETRTSGPILWFGDLIDMGDFKSAVNNQNETKLIKFKFHINHLVLNPDQLRRSMRRSIEEPKVVNDICVEYTLSSKDGISTQLQSIFLSIDGSESVVDIAFEGPNSSRNQGSLVDFFTINETPVSSIISGLRFYRDPSALFSSIDLVVEMESSARSRPGMRSAASVIHRELRNTLNRLTYNRLSPETIYTTIRQILSYKKIGEAELDEIGSIQKTKALESTFKKLKLPANSKDLTQINKLLALGLILDTFDCISVELTRFFTGVRYIGPARARGERYYRLQELEVSEIDPDGRNFPMFLRSLNSRQRLKFSEWVERMFGYGVDVVVKEGHVSIQLIQPNKRSINIADSGYGVSQILPVLGAIWWSTQKPSRLQDRLWPPTQMGSTLLAIEQPELHLHPAHQAHLADTMVSTLKERKGVSTARGGDTWFLVETHSESLINRLGELVERGEVSQDDITIVVFGGKADGLADPADVSISTFDEKGYLLNWPHGFFAYDDYDLST